MNVRCLASLLLLLSPTALVGHAQTTADQLTKKLVGKPYYLRGCWQDDDLHFDREGRLIGRSKITSFTLSGIDVQRVHLGERSLVLEGVRVGVEFVKERPVRVVLKERHWTHQVTQEKVRITMDLAAGSDPGSALRKVLAYGLAEMAPALPDEWRAFARTKILMLPPEPAAEDGVLPGERVQAPRLVTLGSGVVTDAAALLDYDADTRVEFVLSEGGRPTRLSIVSPAGLGLDEVAVEIVRGSTYTAATEAGKPVRLRSTTTIHADTR